MQPALLIRERLGRRWWDRNHDSTALLAVLDRLMECGVDRADLIAVVVGAVMQSVSVEWARAAEATDAKLLWPTIPAGVLSAIMTTWREQIESLLATSQ